MKRSVTSLVATLLVFGIMLLRVDAAIKNAVIAIICLIVAIFYASRTYSENVFSPSRIAIVLPCVIYLAICILNFVLAWNLYTFLLWATLIGLYAISFVFIEKFSSHN